MIRSPFACILAPGAGPRIQSRLAVEIAAQALCSVWIPVHGARAPYWEALLEAQEFYGRPLPETHDLDRTVAGYLDEARERGEGPSALAVMLGVDATVIVSAAGSATAKTGTIVTAVDEALTPTANWQSMALQTNSRAQVDAFARALAAADAIDMMRADTRPVLGSLVVSVDGTRHATSATTIRPPQVEALIEAGVVTGITVPLTAEHVSHADAAWWIGPDFAVTPVTRLLGRDLKRRDADFYRRRPVTHASDGSVFEIAPYTFADGVFTANFRGELRGEPLEFAERFDFTAIGSTERPSEALLKLLALASSLSYYKATYAATIRVAFALTATEITYLRELVKNGLGEYAFVNDMAFKLAPEITAEQAAAEPSREWNFESPPLVAVGGGKDSIVSIEALKATGHKPVLFSVGDRGSIASSVRVSGLEHIIVRRHIDRRLIEANANGAPNGHVPVTAINSAIGLIAAELAGLGPLILSNEESAEYGNLEWNGQNVNHQWSKSLAAEDLLRDTLEDSGLSKDRYFSLLRSFREIEIARAFSHHEQYFHDFTSCNRAYVLNEADRSNGWCGECPKCAFVAIILAPYIDRPQLTSIFGKDMLDDVGLVPTFLDILGVGDQKPFECVGEPSEGVEALTLVVDGGQWADSDVVARLSAAAGRATNNHTSRGPDRVPALFADARDLVGQA